MIFIDLSWGSKSAIPLTNLNDKYFIPEKYDNISRIRLNLLSKQEILIEGNKRFKLLNKNRTDFTFFDTAIIKNPAEQFDFTNRIYLQFEDSDIVDSLLIVISKSETENIYWNQIFLSSVIVSDLNETGEAVESFRIKHEKLVDKHLLINNDELINNVLNYFNGSKDSLRLAECGRNSIVFKSICDKFNLPCRTVGLMGGDAYQPGYNNQVGYPIHALCEIYSSHFKKWYVIDPTYGLRFKKKEQDDFLNAIELSSKYFFNRDNDIVQDSILFTKRTLLGRDYFKYYENVFFDTDIKLNYFLEKILKYFYTKFDYRYYQYTSNMLPVKNGTYYVFLKTLLYSIVFWLYVNSILLVLIKRLYDLRKQP